MDAFLQIALMFAVATGIALFMQFIRQPLVLGHILTGILVGPSFLHLLQDHGGSFELFAKLGITSLLFIVGLSLRPKVVREVGSVAAIAGTAQVVITTLLGALLVKAFGYPWLESFYIGLALAFSSTIIILKVLQDKRDLGSLYGKIATGILLVQDVFATVVLVAMSAMQSGASAGSAIILIIGKAILLGIGLIWFSRMILPSMTKLFASSQEFLLLFSVAWGIGIAALFKFAGFSVEVGALAAGVSLATSPYQYEISAKMKILRDFFLILFFVGLGAGLSFAGADAMIVSVIALSAFVLIGNPLILYTVLRLMKYGQKVSFQAGLTMGQVSEFSLVMLLLAVSLGQVSSGALTLVTLCALVTMAGSSYFMMSSEVLYRLIPKAKPNEKERADESAEKESFDALLFGCHRLGEDFLPYFKEHYKKYLVVDFDPAVIEKLNKRGIEARYGDAEDNEFLDELELADVKLLISTVPDVDSCLFVLSKLRKVNKRTIAIMMAHSYEEAKQLYKAGATYVILPHFLGGNYASLLLEKFGLDQRKFDNEREKHLQHLEDRLKRSRPIREEA